MKYNKEQKEKIFKIYKKLQKMSEPLTNIGDVHVAIEFNSFMRYINGFYGERCFVYNTEIVVEDYYNINRRTFVIFDETFSYKDSDEKIKEKIKALKSFINKFTEDNKDRNLNYVEYYKE